jgi:hypothetical protein
MGLPGTVRVKLSSEEAGYLSITPVVVREMPLAELVETILAATGKEPARVAEVLASGTLTRGASRLRWEGLHTGTEDVRTLLAAFPDPEPARRFEPQGCACVVLRSAEGGVEIPRRTASARRRLRRRSFWDALMELSQRQPLRYVTYCYRQRADCYAADLTPAAALELKAQAEELRYSALRKQLRPARLVAVEFYVPRK